MLQSLKITKSSLILFELNRIVNEIDQVVSDDEINEVQLVILVVNDLNELNLVHLMKIVDIQFRDWLI
jgi:hypothetical protein